MQLPSERLQSLQIRVTMTQYFTPPDSARYGARALRLVWDDGLVNSICADAKEPDA